MAAFDAELIVRTLGAKGLLATACPACKQMAGFALLPGFLPLAFHLDTSAAPVSTATSIGLSCKSCGYILSFLPESLGIS